MKTNELKQHHQSTLTALEQELAKLQGQLLEAKLKLSLGQEKNLHLVKNIRLNITQLKSLIRLQQLNPSIKSEEKKV